MTQYILCSSQFAKKDATISERCQHCVFAMSANFDGENTYYGERERERNKADRCELKYSVLRNINCSSWFVNANANGAEEQNANEK